MDDERGLFKGTTMIFASEGREVPLVLVFLHQNFVNDNAFWEPIDLHNEHINTTRDNPYSDYP